MSVYEDDIDAMILSMDPADVVLNGIAGKAILDIRDDIVSEVAVGGVIDLHVSTIRFPKDQVNEGKTGTVTHLLYTGPVRITERLRLPPDGRMTSLSVVRTA